MYDNLFSQDHESFWVGVDKQFRRAMYSITHEILQANRVSSLIYKLLLLIEGLQIAFFAINTSFDYLWDSSITNVMQQAIQYFQVNGPIQKAQDTVFLMILYIALVIHVITILGLVYCFVVTSRKNKKGSSLFNYFVKYLSFYGIVVNTIGYIPMINIYLSTMYCKSSTELGDSLGCYESLYFVHLSLAVFGFILFAFLQVIFYKLYIDLNPCSNVPFAQSQSSNNLIRLVLKTVLPIYTTFDPEGDNGKAFIVCLAIYLLFLIVNRYISLPYYSKDIQVFSIIIDSSLFWITLVSFVCAFIDDGNISILYIFAGIPLISVTLFWLIKSRQNKILTLSMKNFKKDTDFEHYLILLINLIENRHNPEDSVQLEGVLKFHARYCNKAQDINCNCQSLILDKEDESGGGGYQSNYHNQGNSTISKKWYNFVKYLLMDSFEKFQKSARLHLLHAYIQHGKLQNKFKALLELMVTEELKPNMQEQFSIYRYNHIIEDEISENDARNVENRTIEVNNIVNFQNCLVEFLSSIEASVAFYFEFWNKLMDEIPDVQKLLFLGTKITNSNEKNQDIFENLQNMNPNNIKCLTIYGYYLKDIVNDDQEGNRLLEKAEYVERSNQANKQLVDNEKLKYGENSDTTIITISGNLNQIGIISNSNNEIYELLGYQKSDIIGQNISKLMPKVFGNLHDGFLHRFLETSESRIIGVERTVMCLNKSGYLIPCSLMIKVLPNLDYGIQIVGFLKQIENQEAKSQLGKDQVTHYLIFREDNYQIQGISESIHDYFGIPAQIIYGNSNNTTDFTIDSIAPAIVDIGNRQDLMSAQGLIVQIDSTYVQQNFLIDEEEYEESDYQRGKHNNDEYLNKDDQYQDNNEQKKERKFRQAQVKVNLISEQEFDDGMKVNVITFVEIDTNSDQLENNYGEVDLKNLKTTVKGNTTYGKEDLQSQHNENEDHEMEDEGSNISGSSANDDQRQLKDFKALISERTVPKSIKILNRTALILILILCALSGYDLGFKVTNESQVEEGINAINSGYVLPESLTEVIYYTNLIYQVANGYIDPPSGKTAETYADTFRASLESYVTTLQSQMFEMIKYQNSMQSNSGSSSTVKTYTIKKMSAQGTLSTDEEQLTDSLLTFITQSTGIKTQTLDSLKSGQVNQAAQQIYYINNNGLQSLRISTYEYAEQFYDFYHSDVADFSINYTVVLAIAISFIVISLAILIPIVFQVNRTNNKVLSLFGFIPYPEIKQLSEKCDAYIHQYIISKENHHEVREEWDNEQDNRTNEKKQEIIDNDNNDPHDHNNNGSDYIKGVDHGNGSDKKDTIATALELKKMGVGSQRSMQENKNQGRNEQNGNHKTPNGKDKPEKQTEDHEFIDHRSNLLLNQKDGNKKTVVIKFGFVACLFILYYVLHFIFDKQYIDDIQEIQYHFKLSSLRPSYTQWTQLITQMQIVDGASINDSTTSINLRTYYNDETYSIENSIRKYYSYSFPGKLESYQSLFRSAQTENVCDLISNITSKTSCNTVNNGILTRGFLTASVSFLEELRKIDTEFEATDKSSAQKKSALSASKFQELQSQKDFMVTMMDQLNKKLIDTTTSYLSNRTTIEIIVFCLYIFVMMSAFLFIWLPYMSNINLKIWRTKGMLNMIPMEVINKHESLKNAFIQGDILSAVK